MYSGSMRCPITTRLRATWASCRKRPNSSTGYRYATTCIFGLRGLSSVELIADLRLEEHKDKPTDELSGGLKRRLLVGIAALVDPPLMVLDEPSAGLDPEARHDLWDLLRGYRRQGATVLLTTHNMEEAEVLCDRVGIIQDGSLLALDTVPNLKARHGFAYKITFDVDAKTETTYGASDKELVEQVQDRGIRQYAVSRTTLEDVYLGLTRDKRTRDEGDAS